MITVPLVAPALPSPISTHHPPLRALQGPHHPPAVVLTLSAPRSQRSRLISTGSPVPPLLAHHAASCEVVAHRSPLGHSARPAARTTRIAIVLLHTARERLVRLALSPHEQHMRGPLGARSVHAHRLLLACVCLTGCDRRRGSGGQTHPGHRHQGCQAAAWLLKPPRLQQKRQGSSRRSLKPPPIAQARILPPLAFAFTARLPKPPLVCPSRRSFAQAAARSLKPPLIQAACSFLEQMPLGRRWLKPTLLRSSRCSLLSRRSRYCSVVCVVSIAVCNCIV
jgi:hypothetical protein